jgi:Tol biopolymer transport system component
VKVESGTRIGPYTIVALLGAGGMGEVYRARDERLGRDVALKVLPETLAGDPERLARFRREAQVLASLNHPHIAALYGLEEAGGRSALAIELVDGDGLDAVLKRGPLPATQAIDIARQIAEALETAHERGIIHRDLKPANVKLTQDGSVKLLDFGLARMRDPGAAEDEWEHPGQVATRMEEPTAPGVVLGTAGYMAPEQARGLVVDRRADIWAFGVVLYELLTGRRLFRGATSSDTLAAILTASIDLDAVPASTPATVRTLLARCLERDPRQRLRDIGEARIALHAPGAPPAPAGAAHRASRWPRLTPWAAGGALGLLAALAWSSWTSATLGPAPATGAGELTLGIDAGGDTLLAGVGWVGFNWVGPTAVISPDGRRVVFIARGPSGGRWQLYVRRLDDLKATPLAGTEGAYAPFFSPDSSNVGFFAGGELMTVVLEGGAVARVCEVQEGRGGAWASDDTIVFAPGPEGVLYQVEASGGTPRALTRLDPSSGETTHRWPEVLPGGRFVLFTAAGGTGATSAGAAVVQSLVDGTRTVVHRGGTFARYAASRHLLFQQEGRIFAAPFDAARPTAVGRPVALVDGVAHSPISGTAQFSISSTGVLAYRRARSPDRLLQWMDMAGQFTPLRSVRAEYQEARHSRDGKRLVLVIAEGVQSDVWVYDMARDTMTRITFHPDNDWAPVWSPDGQWIAYSSWRQDTGTFNLFAHRADGGGQPVRLTTGRNRQLAVEWDPLGRYLLYAEERPGTGTDLMLLPTTFARPGAPRVGQPVPLLTGTANEAAGEFSPDGRWLAYTSDESGRSEVYVQPFPGPGGRWQVSSEGAEWVEWHREGELLYGRSEEVVMAVRHRVEGTTFVAESPHVWMRIPPGVAWTDPAPDGVRAAVIRSEETRRESMVLMLGAFDRLRRLTSPSPR